jgi:hypothetical protein
VNENISARLFSLKEAGRVLGGVSHWTLHKHIAIGNVKVTRIGRRVLLTTEELERIRREGLPSLGKAHPERLSDAPVEAAK